MRSFVASLCVVLIAVTILSSEARIFDQYFPDTDFCIADPLSLSDDSGRVPVKACDTALFPVCKSDELICYNRRPHRHLFWSDTRQPQYYIDYRTVYCYPSTWKGCSSCTPGRYCKSEFRCIHDELHYNCTQWI